MRLSNILRISFLVVGLAMQAWFILPLDGQTTASTDSLMQLIRNDQPNIAKITHLNQLAWELMFENPDTAIQLNQQAFELGITLLNGSSGSNGAKKKEIQKELGISNSQLGTCYRLKGDYPLSLIHHLKAFEIREAADDQQGMGGSFYNIGAVYYSQGDYPKALEYYFKALVISNRIADKESMAIELSAIALVYRQQKDYPLALDYLFKGLKICEELGNKNSSALVLNNIGNIYFDVKNNKEAIRNYLESLKLAEELGNKDLQSTLVGNIGNVYLAEKDYTRSLENYFNALKLAEELGEKQSISRHLGNIGVLYLRLKNHKESEDYLKKALLTSEEIGSLELIRDHNKELSNLYSESGKFELAYKHHVQYTIAKDSLFNDEKSKDIGKLEARHEMETAETERTRKAEEDLKIKTRQRERKNLLQYSGITVLLLVIASLIVLLGFRKVSPIVASGVTFFGFLLFFEFLLILLDPTVDKLSGGEPAYKLLFNAGIAALIFPLHAFFERLLKKKLIKK